MKVSRRSAIKMAAGASIIAAIGAGEDAPLERSELAGKEQYMIHQSRLVGETRYVMHWTIEVVFDDETGYTRDISIVKEEKA